jgi:hypothetical protein
MEAIYFSQMSVDSQQTTRQYVQEYLLLHSHERDYADSKDHQRFLE